MPQSDHPHAALDLRAVDALIDEHVFGINLCAVTPAEIGEAVTSGMSYSYGPQEELGFWWNGSEHRQLKYTGSKWGYGGADGNDGYGLWFWELREGASYQADIEAHVAAWRKKSKPYTTSWDAAGQLLEWMREHSQSVTLNWGEDNDLWECSWITSGKRYTKFSKSAPLACSLAALAALGVEVRHPLHACGSDDWRSPEDHEHDADCPHPEAH